MAHGSDLTRIWYSPTPFNSGAHKIITKDAVSERQRGNLMSYDGSWLMLMLRVHVYGDYPKTSTTSRRRSVDAPLLNLVFRCKAGKPNRVIKILSPKNQISWKLVRVLKKHPQVISRGYIKHPHAVLPTPSRLSRKLCCASIEWWLYHQLLAKVELRDP